MPGRSKGVIRSAGRKPRPGWGPPTNSLRQGEGLATAPHGHSEAWTSREPSWTDAFTEVSWVVRRGLAHWPLVLLVTASTVAGATGFVLHRVPPYQARITFRVVEAAAGDAATPPPPAQLQDHVNDVIFSRSHLLEIMEQHDISAALRRIDPSIALESFREDLLVEVRHNTLLHTPRPGAPRTARLTIGTLADDRQHALAVARDLADLIEAFEAERRHDIVHAASRGIESQLQALSIAAADEERLTIVAHQAWLAADEPAERVHAWTRWREAERASTASLSRLADARRHQQRLAARLRAEAATRGLSFELVDENVRRHGIVLKGGWIAVFVAALLVAVGPVVLLLVGAFDQKVRGTPDLGRLGLPMLVRVPAPPRRGSGPRSP